VDVVVRTGDACAACAGDASWPVASCVVAAGSAVTAAWAAGAVDIPSTTVAAGAAAVDGVAVWLSVWPVESQLA
jgi:hypothetical protein